MISDLELYRKAALDYFNIPDSIATAEHIEDICSANSFSELRKILDNIGLEKALIHGQYCYCDYSKIYIAELNAITGINLYDLTKTL